MKNYNKKRLKRVLPVVIIVLGLFGGYYYFMAGKGPVVQSEVASYTWTASKNTALGYELSYPEGAMTYKPGTVAETGMLNPNKKIKKDRFVVSSDYIKGTNLASDSGVTIEVYDSTQLCQAEYVPENFAASPVQTINGKTFSTASSQSGAAGNFYQHTLFKTVHEGKCYVAIAVTHTTNVGAYPAGEVIEYNKAELMELYTKLISTFKVGVLK
ncbi:MAG: hypothetical protein M3Q73_00685 [bacterium]|nr:hypothetical protein [bacterium]